MPRINWARVHASMLSRFGARVAVRDVGGDATFAELFGLAAGVGVALLGEGVRAGESVGVFLRNSRFAVAAMWGAQFAGVCETALNIAYSEAELRVVLGIAGCRVVVCGREHAALFGDLGMRVVVADEVAPVAFEPERFGDVDVGLWGRMGFTSGTTGLPKGIFYHHGTRFVANLALQASLPWLPHGGEAVLLMTPFAHGASLQAAAWLEQGGSVVLHDGVDPERVRPLLEAGAVAGVFAAPTVLAKFASVFGGREFSGVRTVFTGTAPLPWVVYARAREMFGKVVRITYGKTEVFNPIAVLGPEATEAVYAGGEVEGACVGWAGPGVELMLGEEDEILIRARHMSDGWVDSEGGVHGWREDGFHASGDVGRFDAAGRLVITARLSDAMKSGGYKIYPQEVERVLGPECLVLGWPSDYWGEVVVVVAEAPEPGWEARARAACAALAPFRRPRFYFELPAFPRNGQGKVGRRHVLAELRRRWRMVDGPRPVMEAVG